MIASAISNPTRRWFGEVAPILKMKAGPALLVLCALAPVVFIAMYATAASRNIVYWDEVDTVIDWLLKLDAGLDWRGFLERVFAINNEHRMITSRVMFAASWWLAGTVDFRIIGAIGNFFLLAVCGTLIWSATTEARRITLGVFLAFLMFQLEHYENFLWSGASIDHFQVVALAVGAFVCLARGTGLGLVTAILLALLATFTLAHGLVAWPVGALMLWRTGRRRALTAWLASAAGAAALFFQGFEINPGHSIAEFDLSGLGHLIVYWLSLVGAPMTLGYAPLAPLLGILLLTTVAGFLICGVGRRESVALASTLFCLGALAMIALGRSELNGGQLHSRYLVLGMLAWALTFFVAQQEFRHPQRPYRMVCACLPLLVIFNLAAYARFAPKAEEFIEGRDRAALRFKQFGYDGRDSFRLYPVPEHMTRILNEAAQRGLYWMPRMCVREEFPNAKPSARIQYFVDEMTADTRAIFISGWAAIPKQVSHRGEIYLVLRSPQSFIVYSTVALSRPDVAAAMSNPDWRMSGFSFAVGRWRLPPEELQVGILVKHGDTVEYIMTEHRIRPYGKGEALLAGSQ